MSRLTKMLRNLVGGGPRAAGPPRSSGGASSFHLIWEMSGGSGRREGPGRLRLIEVSATLEVLVPPRVRALYFWALQTDFGDGRGIWGGGHAGLQWNARYPDGTAVNWGGYASAEAGGAVLPGSESTLTGFPDDPNTLAYPWLPGRAYRLRVSRSPATPGAWRAEITDVDSAETSVIRDLWSPFHPPSPGREEDGYLVRPIVWSEVFADCDASSVTVRWSDLTALDETGAEIPVEAVRVNYQPARAGGCPNTSVQVDDTGGILQVTSTPRLVEQGTLLRRRAGER